MIPQSKGKSGNRFKLLGNGTGKHLELGWIVMPNWLVFWLKNMEKAKSKKAKVSQEKKKKNTVIK